MPGRKITHVVVDQHLAAFNTKVAAGTCGPTGTFEEYVETLCWYLQALRTAGQLDHAWELPADGWLRRYYNLARAAKSLDTASDGRHF